MANGEGVGQSTFAQEYTVVIDTAIYASPFFHRVKLASELQRNISNQQHSFVPTTKELDE